MVGRRSACGLGALLVAEFGSLPVRRGGRWWWSLLRSAAAARRLRLTLGYVRGFECGWDGVGCGWAGLRASLGLRDGRAARLAVWAG